MRQMAHSFTIEGRTIKGIDCAIPAGPRSGGGNDERIGEPDLQDLVAFLEILD
ncbi:MAG: hypothetical protein BMS9Abin28_2112 [Anaerolineae bacterium]|nr:MAG: hypothetical protein BMS9Abin28_2112 [Anaerolineae bacterium]